MSEDWTPFDKTQSMLNVNGYQYLIVDGEYVLFRYEPQTLRGWKEVHTFKTREELHRAMKLLIDDRED